MRLQNNIYSFVVCIFTLSQVILATPIAGDSSVTQLHTVDIQSWFNSKAFGEAADFDDFGNSFAGQLQLDSNHFIQYNTNNKINNDNIKADGQKIPLPKKPLGALYMLVSASHGPMTVPVNIVYKDGTQDTTMLSLPDWQDEQVNQMERFQVIQYSTSIEQRKGALFSVPIYINPSKVPNYIILPNRGNNYETMHIFSITAYYDGVIITSAQPTNEWLNTNEQVVSVKVHNTGSAWIQNLGVQLESQNIKTVKQGTLEALAPGHVQMVQVTVQYAGKQQTSENVTISLLYTESGITSSKQTHTLLTLQAAPDQYQATTK